MTTGMLILGGLVALAALGVLIGAVMPMIAEIRRTARLGTESVARFAEAVNGIREEEGRIRRNLTSLAETTAAWPQAAVVPRELRVLAHHIKALGAATALLSTFRRSPWRGVQKLVSGR